MSKKKGTFKVSSYESKVINGFLIEEVVKKGKNLYASMVCVNCHRLQPKEIQIGDLLNGKISCRFCRTKFIEPQYEVRYLKIKWNLINYRIKSDKGYAHIFNKFKNFEEFYNYIYPKFEKYKAEHDNNLADMEIGRPDPFDNYRIGNCECQKKEHNLKHERQCFKPFLVQEIETGKLYVCWSQREFARKYDCYCQNISKCLKGKMKKHHGFRFRYLSKTENLLFNEERILYATGILEFDNPL